MTAPESAKGRRHELTTLYPIEEKHHDQLSAALSARLQPANSARAQPAEAVEVKRNLIIAGLALLVLFVGVGIGGSSKAKTTAAKQVTVHTTSTATATVNVTTTPTQVVSTVSVTATVTFTPPLVNEFSDGTYVVGTDIPAGTYHTTGGGAIGRG